MSLLVGAASRSRIDTKGSAANETQGGSSGRRLTRVLACCVTVIVGIFAWWGLSGSVGGSGARALADAGGVGNGDTPGVSLDSLVVPGVQPLDDGQQAVDAQRARHSSASAYVARIRSRTEFEHLGSARAAQVAREAFPEVVDQPAGGPPQMPAGTKLARYVAPDAAQLELPGNRHGIVESMAPMARQTSPGHYTPIDLALTDSDGNYTPASSTVAVQIPKRLADGVRMSGNGVSLTPVDAQGNPLGGAEGSVDGASVLYANTLTDADTVIKPTTLGFEADTLLRSPESPDQIFYRVGLPQGASLVQAEHGPKVVRVVRDGVTIASVLPPNAQDAAGTDVPVSMAASGDKLTLSVSHIGDVFQYPISVDPEVFDEQVTGASAPTRWKFGPFGAAHFTSSGWGFKSGPLYLESTGTYNAGEYGFLTYQTQGESHIYYGSIKTKVRIQAKLKPIFSWYMKIVNAKKKPKIRIFSRDLAKKSTTKRMSGYVRSTRLKPRMSPRWQLVRIRCAP